MYGSKWTKGFAVVLVAVSLFAGCSNNNAPSNTGTDAQVSPQAPSQANDAGTANTAEGDVVNISISYWGSPYEDQTMKSIISKYEDQNPNVKVEGIYIPNSDYTTKMTAMIASGDEPDIAYLFPNDFYPWAVQGRFLELYEMFEKDERYGPEDFIDNAFFEWEEGKCGGKSIANEVIQLYYNKDIFDELGVDYLPANPEDALTWDAFVDICKTLTLDESGNNAHSPDFDAGRIKQYGFDFNKSNLTWAPFVYLNGGDVLNADGTALGLTEEAGIEALQRMGDLINVHHVTPNPITASRSNMSMTAALQSKQVAIICDGTWTNLDSSAANINYDVGCLPKMDGEYMFTATASAMSIFNTTEHPDEAWDFFMFLSDPANAIEIYSSGLWMPLMKAWYEDENLIAQWADPATTGHTEGFYGSAILSVNYPSRLAPESRVKGFSQIDAQIESALETVWLGEKTAAEALGAIEDTANPLVNGYYIIN